MLLRNVVEGVLDGSIPISTLGKRGSAAGGAPIDVVVGLAKQLDKNFSPNEGEQGKRFAQSLVGNGQNAQNVTAINVVPQHAADLVKLTDAMQQNNPKTIQELLNKAKDQFGDKNVPNMEAARFVTAIELLKAAMGPNALNVEVEKQAQQLLSSGRTADQMRSVVREWVDKVVSRGKYLQDLSETYHLSQPIIRRDAQKAIEFLEAKPGTSATDSHPAVPPAQEPSFFDRKIEQIFGGSKPAGGGAASSKPLSPEEAMKLPPGTKFTGTDGIERTRH